MPYSTGDTQKIRDAERLFFERCYEVWAIRASVMNIWPVSLDAVKFGETHAMLCLNMWRAHFCPARVGLPLESNWAEQ